MAKDFETGWLCERGEACAPDYLAFAGGRWYWTPISHHALRMARKEDAEAVACAYGVADTVRPHLQVDRVAEHSWGPLRCEMPTLGPLTSVRGGDEAAHPPPAKGCFGTDELCPNCKGKPS